MYIKVCNYILHATIFKKFREIKYIWIDDFACFDFQKKNDFSNFYEFDFCLGHECTAVIFLHKNSIDNYIRDLHISIYETRSHIFIGK